MANLVLYQITHGGQTALWATGTDAPGSRVSMQSDGSLALYGPAGTVAGRPARTATWVPGCIAGRWQPCALLGGGPALWTSGTQVTPEIVFKGDRLLPDQTLEPGEALGSGNGRAAFAVLREGGLVLFEQAAQVPGGDPLAYWSISNDAADSRLAMQADGNLVLYSPDGTPRWATNTEGNPGAWLVLQDDGNLVIYVGSGPALWASHTVRTWQ